FGDWTAAISYTESPDADGRHGHAEVTIATGSVTIGSVTAQARGPDFFAVERFPDAVFAADLVALPGGGHEARGTLTLKGQAVPVTLPFTLEIAGGTATAAGSVTLDRRAFGIGAGQTDPATLGFEVEVLVRLTARRPET
ncbi:MAG: YceI family protein, partial [Rhodobacteraceae bacterium]|nr:YceI family protein [Paracoccaceae bacterium]